MKLYGEAAAVALTSRIAACALLHALLEAFLEAVVLFCLVHSISHRSTL